MPEPLRLKGIAASGGYAEGPLYPLHREEGSYLARGNPHEESEALRAAIAHASARIGKLIAAASEESAAILEFQLAMLEDKTLTEPAFAAIAEGTAAGDAWVDAIDAEIVGYEVSDDHYFRARAADLKDIRGQVLRALTDGGDEASPPGAILFGDDIAPTRFLETDWSLGGGIALTAGSTASHVAMLARSRGVPMVVGLGAAAIEIDGTALLDAEHGGIVLSPTAADIKLFRTCGARLRRTPCPCRRFPASICGDQDRRAGARAGQYRRPGRRRCDRHCRLRRRRADAHRVPVRQGFRPARRGHAIRRLPQGAGVGGQQAGHHPHRRCRRRQAGAGLHGRGRQPVPRPAWHQAVAGAPRDIPRADPGAAARRAARQPEGDVPDDCGGGRI